jgi:SAM-dependent methyltransferase
MDNKTKQAVEKYLSKTELGLEIGPGPDPITTGNVVYADPIDTSWNGNPILAHSINRMGDLNDFNDNTFGWVAFRDVLEHVPDPILGLLECKRVLKDGGTLFALIPDKRYTYDVDRPITSLQHLIADFMTGVDTSEDEHWEEWCKLVLSKQEGEEHRAREKDKERQLANGWLHRHVWDASAMYDLFLYVFPDDEIVRWSDGFGCDGHEVLIVVEVHK